MSDNDNHQPISGKLYRVANCAWKSLSTHEGPVIEFDSATQFLLCLPRRKNLPGFDFFLVSGTVHIFAWLGPKTEESISDVWLQEVKPEETDG